jgi:hypothetical protein
MFVRYPMRSRFVKPIQQAIKLARSRLEQGRPVEIPLGPGGYRGRWVVIIRLDNHEEFEAVGSLRDPTRFP